MEVMFHIIAFALIVICFVVFVLTGFIAFLIVHSRFGSAQQSRQEGRQRPGYWGFLLKGLWSNRFLRTTGFLVLGLFLALMCQAFISDFYAAGEIRAGFASASRLVVRSGGNCHRRSDHEIVLYDTSDPKEIQAVSDCIALNSSVPFFMGCWCCGDMTFDLYVADRLAYSFSLHHMQSIRIKDRSRPNIDLSSSSRRELGQWLKQRGILKRLEEFQQAEFLKETEELEKMRAAPKEPEKRGRAMKPLAE